MLRHHVLRQHVLRHHVLRTLQLTWQVRSLEGHLVVLRALGPEVLRADLQQQVLRAQKHGSSQLKVELRAVAEEQQQAGQEWVEHSWED